MYMRQVDSCRRIAAQHGLYTILSTAYFELSTEQSHINGQHRCECVEQQITIEHSYIPQQHDQCCEDHDEAQRARM